jgi:hypothetical protein
MHTAHHLDGPYLWTAIRSRGLRAQAACLDVQGEQQPEEEALCLLRIALGSAVRSDRGMPLSVGGRNRLFRG